MIRLAIWGVEHDSSENPFDLIEVPYYEKTYTEKAKPFFGKLLGKILAKDKMAAIFY
jgi:transcription elongation factor GreA-like protein